MKQGRRCVILHHPAVTTAPPTAKREEWRWCVRTARKSDGKMATAKTRERFGIVFLQNKQQSFHDGNDEDDDDDDEVSSGGSTMMDGSEEQETHARTHTHIKIPHVANIKTIYV